METTLHRELKRLYAGPAARMEVRVGKFRVDAVMDGDGYNHDGDARHGEELIEIQHGPLWTIRDKIRSLTAGHRVRVVKPIIGRKLLVKRCRKAGRIVGRRHSPRQGRLLELFHELVYFTRAFPHPNLAIDVLLVDVEEWRYPRPKSRRWYRRDFLVEDQKLVAIRETVHFTEPAHLMQLIPCDLPSPFHTAHLAAGLDVPRWEAQRIAYVLRQTGAAEAVGKQRRAWLYQWPAAETRRAA